MKKTQQPPFQSFIQRTNTLLKYQWGPLLPAIPLDPEFSAPGRRTPWKLAKPLTEHYQVDWAWHKVGQVTIVTGVISPYCNSAPIFFFEFVIPLGAAVQSFGFHEKNKKHNLPRKSIPENSSQGIFCLRPT